MCSTNESVTQCYKDSQKSVESDPFSGRPVKGRTPEKVESVRAAINKDVQLIVDSKNSKLICGF